MGAGNPKLKSFDNDRFEPKTFFIDISEDIEQLRKQYEEDGEDVPSDETLYDIAGRSEELNFEDLIESLSSELGMKILYGDNNLGRRAYHSELTYGFREEGILLLEGKHCFIITSTDGEGYHLPIGVIPNFKFEDLHSEEIYDNSDKEKWYDARKLDFSLSMEKRAETKWNKLIKEFHKEAEKVLNTIHTWYPKKMGERNGAWMSLPIITPNQLVA
jgi:hypothetical protein